MRSVDWDRHSADEKTKFFYRLEDEDQKTYGVCRIVSDYSHKKSFAAHHLRRLPQKRMGW